MNIKLKYQEGGVAQDNTRVQKPQIVLPLKTIRFELDHFPSEEECDRHLSKDGDVRFYIDRGVEISYNNLREYQL